MSARDEALSRIQHAIETNATWLDLGDLGLEELPKEIGDLPAACQTLALGKLEIVEKDGEIEWEWDDERPDPLLRNLKPLAGLASLQSLDLGGCDGVADLSPLAGLASLQTLYLGDCA